MKLASIEAIVRALKRLDALLALMRRAGRPQDLADIDALTRLAEGDANG